MDDEESLIYVCRDIPGPHTGGPECFCCPHVIGSDDARSTEEIMIEIAEKERKQ